MKAVVSTVSEAAVTVAGETVGAVEGPALLALVGVGREDSPEAWETIARKIAELRLFSHPDEGWDGSRDYSATDIGASVLVVSQFTLMGATAKGRRPSWAQVAPGEEAEPIIDKIVDYLRGRDLHVETGRFGAMMRVRSVNEGPYTVIIEK